MNTLIFGTYVPGDSVVHRLDPRVKMLATLLLMVLPFALHGIWGYVLVTAFVLAVNLIAGVPLLALLRTLQVVFWIGFLMFFLYLFTTPGHPLIAWHGVAVTWEGVLTGASQIYRLGLLVITASLLTFTTSPVRLAHGVEAMLAPLERLRVPVRDLAMVLLIALRFVPTLLDEVDKIVKAQRARGAELTSGGPLRRARGLVPVFVPIFVSAFRRADELATAMDARGFRASPHRTRLQQLALSRMDFVATLIVLTLCLTAIGLERLL